MDKRVSPEIVGSNWHNIYDGIEWRHDDAGVYIRSRQKGRRPLRTDGDPIICKTIMELYGQTIFRAAIRHGVPVELIVMTIATETGHLIRDPFTGIRSFRWEDRYTGYSAGPMQILDSTVPSIVES